jgi:indole-3-glycerol phosphate synthase
MGFLTDLVDELRRRLEREPLDESGLMALAMHLPPPRPFEQALRGTAALAMIAEYKRSSPSAGAFAGPDLASQARAYQDGGAAAISVLTEPTRFDGSLADVRAARLVVDLPVLRKDFLVHPAQLIESRAAAADAVLLIASVLSELELKGMLAAAEDLGLGTLVETHSEEDLAKALATDAPVVGVNARDLETLEVDVDRALSLLPTVPSERVAVLESGVSTREHVERAIDAGARAVLVGDALMRSPDPAAAIRSLRGAT